MVDGPEEGREVERLPGLDGELLEGRSEACDSRRQVIDENKVVPWRRDAKVIYAKGKI